MIECIFNYLESNINNLGNKKSRWFYGFSFLLASLDINGEERQTLRKFSLDEINKININSFDFHWEFNKYALYYCSSIDSSTNHILNDSRFNNSKATNWKLLNYLCRLQSNKQATLSVSDYLIIRSRISSDGFIWDAHQVRSSQYHFFSSFLLGEIYKITRSKKIKRLFLKSVKASSFLMLYSGQSNYLGRGQFQSFSYGPLIYTFLLADRILGNNKYQTLALRQLTMLNEHIVNGYIPLVITNSSKEVTDNYDSNSINHLGWYPYNNFSDYSMFLLFFLVRIKNDFPELDIIQPVKIKHNIEKEILLSSGISIISRDRYQLVTSSVRGYVTNHLIIPYFELEGVAITPVVGGEQFSNSLYKPYMFNFPSKNNCCKYEKFHSLLFKQKTNMFFSKNGIVNSKIKDINNNSFSCVIDFRFSFFNKYNLSFFTDNYCVIGNNTEITFKDVRILINKKYSEVTEGYSASGSFSVFSFEFSSRKKIEISFYF